MNIEKVTVKKVINGGFGLAHLSSGRVVLLPRGLPGEELSVTIDKSDKNLLFGKIKQIHTPHRARRAAPCKYYAQCGGCDMQHCETSWQLTIKKDILADLLSRSPESHVQDAISKLQNTIASPCSFSYRQRIRLQIDEFARIGFRQFRSHKIVPINGCLLAAEPINDCLKELHSCTDFHDLATLATELELLLNPASQKVVCLIRLPRKPRPADIKAAKSICNHLEPIERIFFQGENFPISGPYSYAGNSEGQHLYCTSPAENSGSSALFNMCWEVGGFCQVNLEQNLRLIKIVLEFCQVTAEDTILDLFCGMGNFSIPLAKRAKKLVGIEGQGGSIRSAKTNAENHGLTNTCFTKSPIHVGCKKLLQQDEVFDYVVIDPPRQGVPGLAADLATLTKKCLVYISCDPATLCRDLGDLTRAGFEIKQIQPVDMFPQTHHIETVVLLEKCGNSLGAEQRGTITKR